MPFDALKASKSTFLKPRSSKIIVTKEKTKEKRKERGEGKEEKKKSNGCTLTFFNSYFLAEINCWTQIKGLFGDNVIKNPARYTSQALN